MIKELTADLCKITGFPAMSLQPNSGAQGEYAGLSVIQAYHRSKGDTHRNICLIPGSAHGTNPASAIMAGMKVVPVKNKSDGTLDVEDLRAKAEKHKDNLAAFMVTYPSTYGVFEDGVSSERPSRKAELISAVCRYKKLVRSCTTTAVRSTSTVPT